MGVFCTDRLGGAGFGLSNRLWRLLGRSLAARRAPLLDQAFTCDGHVPSWLGRAWGLRVVLLRRHRSRRDDPAPAPGSAVSEVAARTWQARSGLFPSPAVRPIPEKRTA